MLTATDQKTQHHKKLISSTIYMNVILSSITFYDVCGFFIRRH